MNYIRKPSDEQKKAILVIEALGLLHDIGKLSDLFIKSQDPAESEKSPYYYKFLTNPKDTFSDLTKKDSTSQPDFFKKWVVNLEKDRIDAPYKEIHEKKQANLKEALTQLKILSWGRVEYDFAELLPFTQPRFNKKLKLLNELFKKEMFPAILVGCIHGIAHYEKENPNANKQTYKKTYTASPFGYEQLIQVGKDEGLSHALSVFPFDRIHEITTDKREIWIEDVKKLMNWGLAETQRPTNEVTLWDWGFIVASMAKSAAAFFFIEGTKPDLNKLVWRTGRISLDILGQYARSDTIGDLLGVKSTISESYEKVKKLIEEEYAIANRIYHDETGAYYLFPNIDLDQEFKEKIQGCFPQDIQPQVHFEKAVSGNDLDPGRDQADDAIEDSPLESREAVKRLLSEPRNSSLEMMKHPVKTDHNLYIPEDEWKHMEGSHSEVCNVCGFYPVGYPRQGSREEEKHDFEKWAKEEKAKKRNICRICLNRRGRRSKDWAQDTKEVDKDTIWTNEVSDNSGRLALLVGSLDLEGWLDGTLLSSLFVDHGQEETKRISPVRLYRIVETARDFWSQVISRVVPDTIKKRPYRLAFKLSRDALENENSKLFPSHAYEISTGGVTLDAVWDGEKFISAENLAYCAKRTGMAQDDFDQHWKNVDIKIQEHGGPGKSKEEVMKSQIIASESLPGYSPTIPMISEPGICMILVPGEDSFRLVQKIKAEYEKQMGRVRDRLPIYLGLVFFRRRTPIRAVLEAGRSMLDMGGDWLWDEWPITDVSISEGGVSAKQIQFQNGITWKVPFKTGGNEIVDHWYPYYLTRKPDLGCKIETKELIHISELGKTKNTNQNIFVRPSRFDFEFLDTTGRRFEINYLTMSNNQKIYRPSHPTKPYLLEDIDRIKGIWEELKKVKKSQRYQVIQIIERTRELWFGGDLDFNSWTDPVFRQFVKDTLAGAQWDEKHSWDRMELDKKNIMVSAGVKGELADIIELHMEILKEK